MRGQAGGHRVLRGGSWNNDRNNARCANRNRNNPNNWNNNVGLRLVVSHVLLFGRKCRPANGAARGRGFETRRGLSLATGHARRGKYKRAPLPVVGRPLFGSTPGAGRFVLIRRAVGRVGNPSYWARVGRVGNPSYWAREPPATTGVKRPSAKSKFLLFHPPFGTMEAM